MIPTADTCKIFYEAKCFGYGFDCRKCKEYIKVKDVKKAEKRLKRVFRGYMEKSDIIGGSRDSGVSIWLWVDKITPNNKKRMKVKITVEER